MKRLVSVFLALTVFSSTLLAIQSTVGAASWVPGVKAGDTAKYDLVFAYNTSDPNPPLPPPPDSSQIDYVRVQVQSVINSLINAQATVLYLNGSDTSFPVSVDLMNPSDLTVYPFGSMFFIGANLSSGDRIYQPLDAPTINMTLMRSYVGATRLVNYLNASVPTPVNYVGYTGFESMQFYWDRESGIVDEIRQIIILENASKGYFTYAAIIMTMNDNNIWTGTLPTDRVPGVKAGDWAKYSLLFNLSSDDPNPPVGVSPPLDNIDYYLLEILSVSGSNVTYRNTFRYVNGSEQSMTDWIDVANGHVQYGMGTFGFLVAANLTAPEKLYLNDYAPAINFSDTGVFAGSQRVVNHVVLYQTVYYSGQFQSVFYGFAWDKASGMLVSLDENVTMNRMGYLTQMRISVLITETNIWAPTPAFNAEVRFSPGVLNLKSHGGAVSAFVVLPENVSSEDVDFSTVRINGTLIAFGSPAKVGKHLLVFRFDRSELVQFLKESLDLQMRRYSGVTLTMTVTLKDGSILKGSDRIVLITPMHDKDNPLP